MLVSLEAAALFLVVTALVDDVQAIEALTSLLFPTQGTAKTQFDANYNLTTKANI